MKKEKTFLISILAVFCVWFSSCQMENPIMETWWDDGDRNLGMEWHELLQNINIIDVQFILFSGDQVLYNSPAVFPATTDLSDAEKATNDRIISNVATILRQNPSFVAILHGHANPQTPNPDEAAELMRISIERARSVEAQLLSRGIDRRRLTANGYGGELNISDSHLGYPVLNRRVEIIIANITTSRR